MSSFTLPPDCLLTFTDVHARTGSNNAAPLLSGVSGYVRRGGLTAVLGSGASGKSLLLRLLCGREPLLRCSGHVTCDGQPLRLDSTAASPLGFVGQEDTALLGELTPRDVIGLNARLGSAGRRGDAEVDAIVDGVIRGLGLSDVANNVIGTVLRRGLSGGEKRRVSVGAVLASRPAVLCLDEATSGLDAAVAYAVIQAIKALALADGVGVMLTIHQPSARILTLCDDLLLLHGGSAVYCGPTELAVGHFAALGFPCPAMTTPTDHFLDVVRNAPGAPAVFVEGYAQSDLYKALHTQLTSQPAEAGTKTGGLMAQRRMAPFHTQVAVLLRRNLQVATKDVSLYYLQMVLAAGFAFMTGAVFWQLPRIIGHRMSDISNGIVWLTFITSYLQIFKVYHLFTWKERVVDEHSNGLYSYAAWTVANFLTSALLMFCVYVPSLLIGYAMMGLPNGAIGTIIAFIFLLAITSEAMVELFCHFTDHLPTAILVSQGSMVILCVYAGGAFIRFDQLGFWVWLSELSLYTFSSRGMLIAVFKRLSYSCPADFVSGAVCTDPSVGVAYACEGSTAADGSCQVAGLSVLQSSLHIGETDEWQQFGYLVALFVGFRLLVHLCLLFPPRVVASRAYHALVSSSPAVKDGLRTGLGKSPASPQTSIPISPAHSPTPGPPLRFLDVSLTLNGPSSKPLVQHISGFAQSGRVLAILGPSGAGKTTLLNAISGRAPYATIAGSVGRGGRPLSSAELSYVPQFDCLNLQLTIQQTFVTTARMQRGAGEEVAGTVEELLEVLSLTERKNHLVARLSSGERKRAAIGLALLARPRVQLLDEPTTGLDSATSAVIVDYIRRVTRRTGVICVLTLHQPSSALFASLDDLLLLAKGKAAYFGPTSAVTEYFTQHSLAPPDNSNPADHFLDLMNDRPDAVAQHWEESKDAFAQQHTKPLADSDEKTSLPLPPHPTELQRLVVLTGTRALYFWQEQALYLYRLVELLIIAIFIGTLFLRLHNNVSSLNELSGAVFFKVWVILFVAISGTPILVRDRLVFENEHLNGTYRAWTFCLATFLASVPYQLVSAVLYEGVLWFLVGFNDAFEPFVFSVASSFALLLLMEGIALIIIQVLKDAMLATTFSMVVLGILFLFPGFFESTTDMVQAVRWISYVVPTHYSLWGQLYNIFHAQTYDDGRGGTISGDDVLQRYYSVSESYSKWLDFFIVLCYTALFRVLHWALLVITYRKYGHRKAIA